MLDIQGTLSKFGYDPTTLKRYSERLILIVCDFCHNSHQTIYARFYNNPNMSCGQKDCRKKLTEKTCLEKYGVKHHLASSQVKNTRKQNNLKKYGVEHISKREEIKQKIKEANLQAYAKTNEDGNSLIVEKIKQTNQQKYGVDFAIKAKEIKAKAVETLKKNYGVENPFNSPEIVKAIENTNLTKYGVKNPFQSPEIKEKIKATNLERYGTENPSSSPNIRQAVTNTNLVRYGYKTHLQDPDIKANIRATNLDRYGTENPFGSKECIAKARETKIVKYGTANPNNCYGKTEKEIGDWLFSVSGKAFKSNYSLLQGKEVDLYNEELKLGIEYCGLYWHTEDSKQKRDRNYHEGKLKALNSQGVRLITIFEDEWVYRQAQVKNFLKAVLGVYETRVLSAVSSKEAQQFFEDHHIQGKNTLGMYFAGLFYKDTLVAAMSFGRHHRNSSQLTLDRFAVKTGLQIPGGASRLFKFLLTLSKASDVISWSDNRWSEGNVYRQLGFSLEAALPPDYSYVDFSHNCRRVSKQSQRKAKTGCPAHITEKDFALAKNLHRIWDCGKLRWSYHK